MRLRTFGFNAAAVVAAVAFLPSLSRGAVVTGMNGVNLSVYPNPFDPNGDFVATETTKTWGNPTTGLVDSWGEANDLHNAVNRRDGRSFYGGVDGAWIKRNGDTTGPAAYMQFQAPAAFTVGTVITAHSIGFGGYSTPQPYELKFSNGNPGQTTADWAAKPVFTSGPGTVLTHPITVIAGNGGTADTFRIEYSGSSIDNGSAVAFNEVTVLPDQLALIPALVTSQSAGAVNMQGAVDGNGISDNSTTGLWYDQSANPVVSKFFEMQLNGGANATIAAMMLFPDGPTAFLNQEFNIRKDGAAGAIIANIKFTNSISDIVPIKFDTPVTTSVLRFEWVSEGTGNASDIREVLVFSAVPEPSSLILVTLGAVGVLLQRSRRCRVA